jgi:hypothetical protein
MTEFKAKKDREANKGYGGKEEVAEEEETRKKKTKKENISLGDMVPKARRHLKV